MSHHFWDTLYMVTSSCTKIESNTRSLLMAFISTFYSRSQPHKQNNHKEHFILYIFMNTILILWWNISIQFCIIYLLSSWLFYSGIKLYLLIVKVNLLYIVYCIYCIVNLNCKSKSNRSFFSSHSPLPQQRLL